MQWVHKLKEAFKNDNVLPYFQPIYDNTTQKIASCESLVRLIDNDGNIISPFHFLTVAKKSRLYPEITRIVIQKSCQYFQNIDCDFSINLSIEDMLHDETIEYLKEQIIFYNIAHKMTIEILETEGIENYEEVASFLTQMKKMGCKIAIDDFGSGYSSFEYLLKLHVDYIKIDGTLIKNIDTDTNSAIVVETIVNFAKKLNILTVAEFVHNKAVFEKVKELGVDRSQGFYLSEPKDDIKNLL
jgi:EAL domain-containing protein (putative c-di-GMP-specific phosphodiesterase class I)